MVTPQIIDGIYSILDRRNVVDAFNNILEIGQDASEDAAEVARCGVRVAVTWSKERLQVHQTGRFIGSGTEWALSSTIADNALCRRDEVDGTWRGETGGCVVQERFRNVSIWFIYVSIVENLPLTFPMEFCQSSMFSMTAAIAVELSRFTFGNGAVLVGRARVDEARSATMAAVVDLIFGNEGLVRKCEMR